MKLEEYEDIKKTIASYKGMTKDCIKMLIEKYPSFERFTLCSILSQEVQQKMKINHRRVFDKNTTYLESYEEAVRKNEPRGILMRQATLLDTCPALYARRILEEYYKFGDDKTSKSKANQLMRDTHMIDNPRLALEVYMCVMYDDQYGPLANAISESVGEEYEVLLRTRLEEQKIDFRDEEYLREKGYDKTPDFKLEIPIAVDNFIVNWIESKAQFGSPDVHKKYTSEQFSSYWNRFGRGLVIYWFGYVDDIKDPKEKRFTVMDRFPENITRMDPDLLL